MTHANHQGEPGDTGTKWVLVPREPTKEMIFAASGIRPGDLGYPAKSHMLRFDYRAMIASAPTPPDRVGEEVGRGNVLPSWVADMQPTLSRSGNDITLSYSNPNDAAYTFAEMERFFGASDFAFAPSPEAGAGGDLGELDDVQAALKDCSEAVAFFDQVKRSTQAEQIAVGADHWNWLEAACRRTADVHRSGKLVAFTGSGKEETKGAPITQDEIVKLIAKTWLTAKDTSDEDAEEIAEPGELALISPEDHAACVEIADTLLHRFAQAAGEVRHDQ